MTNSTFEFYSVLKNEDAKPYIGDNIIAVADGLGGSGSAIHTIDREKHTDMHGDIMSSAFRDMQEMSPQLMQYVEDLIAPMVDGKDDTSALWASRIAIARCVYALTGEFKNAELSDKKTRERLAEFISVGLREVAKKFDLQNGKYDGQLLLPTTLAFVRYTEKSNCVIAETVWAGDSRCYALTTSGLKLLSVDDEDNSGSITNLFYAENKSATLNYICHEIAKPCALFAVSDGIFDPFDPHENLGVEHALLSAIYESNSLAEVASTLCDFYASVHGDDATMAFDSFGFDSFEDMQKMFAKRTEEILSVRKKQSRLYGALEVVNQTEEEASHYVLSRMSDRYDYIIPILADAMSNNVSDIALTQEVRQIAKIVKEDCVALAEKAKKQNRERAFSNLYDYVKNHPELISQILTPYQSVNFGMNHTIANAFANMQKSAAKYIALINDEALNKAKTEFETKRETLHQRVMQKINHYRNEFDCIWADKHSDYKMRSNINVLLRIWQEIDLDLQYNWRISNIGNLPLEDRALAFEIRDYINEYRKFVDVLRESRSNAEYEYRLFTTSWNTVYNYLNRCFAAIQVLLTPEAVRQLGFATLEELSAHQLTENIRNRIISQLKAQKTVVVADIVKSLKANYDKTSIIDSQFNGTKLHLFRTYFALKTSGSGDAKALEEQLAMLEKEYTSLLTK